MMTKVNKNGDVVEQYTEEESNKLMRDRVEELIANQKYFALMIDFGKKNENVSLFAYKFDLAVVLNVLMDKVIEVCEQMPETNANILNIAEKIVGMAKNNILRESKLKNVIGEVDKLPSEKK